MLNELTKLQEIVTMARKDEVLKPLELKAQREVGAIFKRQGDLFLESFQRHRSKFVEAATPGDVSRDFDDVFNKTSISFKETLREINERAFELGATEQIEDLQAGLSFNLENPRARQWIEQRSAEMVTRINETTRERINQILQDASKNGWNYSETQKAIRAEFDQFSETKPQLHIRNRAELVAVTENAMAFEEGKKEAIREMQEFGLKIEKYWSNTGDNRVSVGCLNNTSAGWIDEDEVFPSGHDVAPRFPGCRCAVLHRRKQNDE